MSRNTCDCLRYKGYHERADPDALEAVFVRNHVPYRCLMTGQPWGTDGDVAAPETCTPDRVCFEPRDSLLKRVWTARRRDHDH